MTKTTTYNQETNEEAPQPKCKTHPDAPHGFLRNESHAEDRYVCECEFWEPPEQEREAITALQNALKGST